MEAGEQTAGIFCRETTQGEIIISRSRWMGRENRGGALQALCIAVWKEEALDRSSHAGVLQGTRDACVDTDTC